MTEARPPSGRRISRRTFVVGAAGAAGLAAAGGIYLWSGSGQGTTALTLGSNYSDVVPKQALQDVIDAFKESTGTSVAINTTDPTSYQNRISTYLQTTPDDDFAWFAGERMRFFAAQGLASDVSDVWSRLSGQYSDAVRLASTGADGRQYFVPFITYPWAVIYRPSVWQRFGYNVPQTWTDLLALCQQMTADGLVPFAYADREGWTAMGTFDIIDLRLNGYDFHMALMAGDVPWTDARVAAVFERWRELVPFLQKGALGRTWQEAARSMISGEAGMFYLGTYAAEQATAAERDDLEIAHFPLLGTPFDGELAVEAPINGFMMSARPQRRDDAARLLEFLGTGEAQNIYAVSNPTRIAVARGAAIGGYTHLQRRASELIAGAARVTQYLDRDTRPDFAGPQGMQAFLADFLTNPDQDIQALLGRVQAYRDSLAPTPS